MNTSAELAIVIPAKNEADHLPRLLASLCAQDYDKLQQTRILIADAASTDGTAELAQQFCNRLNIQVIAGGTPSVGRNRGARSTASQWILFLDADVELRDTTLLRRAVQRMQSRQLHCLTTNIACSGGTWTDRLLYRANSRMQRLSSWIMPFGTGMFLLLQRKRFEELGGFAEDALFAEDFLLTKQISTLRFSVLDADIYTSNRRFRRTGHGRMVFLFFWTILNSSRRTHFQRDHGYWKETPATAAD